MTKTKTTDEYENYYCKKLDKTVVITRRRLIQGMKKLRPSGIIDCDHATECDVSSYTSRFDWSKCIHPERK